jgi:serine/threonine protein kinase
MFHMPTRIDRYEIKTLIGAGGMGSLYLARDTNPNTNRLVALKLLLANIDSGDLRERFAREARALAALNHPNIVDIYDSGEFQGSPFIVMEYVRGETLAEKIKRRAPMSLAQKLKLMAELCSGLQHAHEAGIIHRDIKPANLMVDRHGRLKVLDFGIARVSEGLTRMGLQVTQINMRIGTPGYMSPEQIEGNEIDRRSDIFAVGTVCYELLTYREAFTGNNTRQVENKVLGSHPEPLNSLIPDLDPELQAILDRALAKDPNDRYQDASALEDAFERLRWKLGPAETPMPTPPRVTPNPATPARKGTDSRADAVYQRCLAVYAEGAHDAARRFAIEALAEDPDHDGAREFMKRFGPSTWPPLPARTQQAYTASGPTVLRTENYPAGTMTADAETVLSTSAHPSGSSARARTNPHQRFGKRAQVAAIVAAVLVLVAGAVAIGMWMWTTGPTLTVSKPEGGTILGRGINCGSGGTNCSTQFTKGEGIDLTAEPDEGFVFAGFTGDCRPHGRILMTEGRTCGATFTKVPEAPAVPMVQLTVIKPTGGTLVGDGITCGTRGDDCVVEHPKGKVVKLMALAEAEFTFKGFTGGGCLKNGEAVLTEPRSCGAMFVKDRAATATTAASNVPSNVPSSVPRGASNGSPSSPRGGGRSAGSGGGGRAVLPPDPYANVGTGGGATAPTGKPNGYGSEVGRPAAPTPDSIARDSVMQVLESYRVSYEQRDVDALQKVYPTAPSNYINGLKYAFKQYKSLEYTFTADPEFLHVDPALGTATVKRPTLMKPEYKGPGSPPLKHVNTFTLKRENDVWSIVDLRSVLVK